MEMETSPSSPSKNPTKTKMETLQAMVSGPLLSSIAKLSGSSRCIPSEEDFHFYYNFREFKDPVKQIVQKSQSLLKAIGDSSSIVEKEPFPDEPDDEYDWLVDLNDQLFERFELSLDEFKNLRKKQEEGDSENGDFQLVSGKKKKKGSGKDEAKSAQRIPFHNRSITKPQEEFKIVVDNSNQPFEHVWLEKSEDGSRFIHPLEKFSELDFVDRNIGDVEPVKPLPLDCTPFKIVEKIEDLKELAAKLREANEFAVDLEHNQYRSFQGLTCLMQISTRMEDFVVDTLKLRAYIGPYLREVFKDPSKKKIMHGADRDILWLQRDFGIYVCNLFDTGQASRVLQLERNSLEYLLHHFCEVAADKQYQNADWRLRPLPNEMLKYAREDTHYLLYIYDQMRVKLLAASTSSENDHPLLLEVYQRSYDVCMQLYEKEILTDTSYLYIYGLRGADFNAQQVSIVSALCEWRDAIARTEDESTGFILPNKALLDIAREMPDSAGKLRKLVGSKHKYVERNLGSVSAIIKKSIQNASVFESAVELLKKSHAEMAALLTMEAGDESVVLSAPEHLTAAETVSTQPDTLNAGSGNSVSEQTAACVATSVHAKEEQLEPNIDDCGKFGQSSTSDGHPMELSKESFAADSGQIGSTNSKIGALQATSTVTEATVQVLKKPSRAFGAFFGISASKKKPVLDPKAESKVEEIKSSVTLQFHSFPGKVEQPNSHAEQSSKSVENAYPKELVSPADEVTKFEDIISLENESDQEIPDDAPTVANNSLEQRENSTTTELASDTGDVPMSLSELSSSFQICFNSINGTRNIRKVEKSQESNSLQLQPFDYATAREQIVFGRDQKEAEGPKDDDQKSSRESRDKRRKSSITSRGPPRDEGATDFPSVRRRQAFPHTGNRSTTFR